MSAKTKKRLDLPGSICPETEQAFYNCRLKLICEENGEKKLIQRLFTEKPIFPPPGYERRRAASEESKKLRLTRAELERLTGDQLDALVDAEDPRRRFEEASRETAAEYASNRTEWLIDHAERSPENVQRSARRARGRVCDYVLANPDLKYFITLTLNGEDFARDDVQTAFQKLRVWLNNRVQRAGLKYVMVPEFHKDGKSVHFHGFINAALTLTDSGTVIPPGGGKPIRAETAQRKGVALCDCKTVYNIPEWGYGFTTAIELYGDRIAAARYAAKYVTKEVERTKGDAKKSGGRWYWSSNNLRLPEYVYCNDDFEAAPGEAFDTPAGRMKVQYENTEYCKTAPTRCKSGGPFSRESAEKGERG